jgi:hypothetical protein
MKQSPLFVLSFIICISLLCACGSGRSDTDQTLTQADSIALSVGKQPIRGLQKFSINDKQGNTLVSFDLGEAEYVIRFRDRVLMGQRKTGKTTYLDNNGDLLIIAKIRPDKIKLLSGTEEFRWQAKIKDQKVKISKDPEGANPFEIKQQDPNHYFIYFEGRELGKTKYKERIIDVDGIGTDLKIPATNNSFAFGLLLLRDIPEVERYILMAELLGMGI